MFFGKPGYPVLRRLKNRRILLSIVLGNGMIRFLYYEYMTQRHSFVIRFGLDLRVSRVDLLVLPLQKMDFDPKHVIASLEKTAVIHSQKGRDVAALLKWIDALDKSAIEKRKRLARRGWICDQENPSRDSGKAIFTEWPS